MIFLALHTAVQEADTLDQVDEDDELMVDMLNDVDHDELMVDMLNDVDHDELEVHMLNVLEQENNDWGEQLEEELE